MKKICKYNRSGSGSGRWTIGGGGMKRAPCLWRGNIQRFDFLHCLIQKRRISFWFQIQSWFPPHFDFAPSGAAERPQSSDHLRVSAMRIKAANTVHFAQYFQVLVCTLRYAVASAHSFANIWFSIIANFCYICLCSAAWMPAHFSSHTCSNPPSPLLTTATKLD